MDRTQTPLAPELFALWTSGNIANDKKFGRRVFRYHPRSDEHSKTLCSMVLRDIVDSCPLLAVHAREGKIVAGINAAYRFPNGKTKTLDLALGTPLTRIASPSGSERVGFGDIGNLRIALEAKQCMTEHSKSQPRLFDELSSAHEIVHQGHTNAISAGIVVLNIASRYASPTRQTSGYGPPVFTSHRQPAVTASMVNHLRGLLLREKPGEVGFDAFATIVINCDNVGACTLHTAAPAPQPGERDHYETLVARISAAYAARFSG